MYRFQCCSYDVRTVFFAYSLRKLYGSRWSVLCCFWRCHCFVVRGDRRDARPLFLSPCHTDTPFCAGVSAWSMVWFRWGCTASCGWNVRCVGVRGDAWPVLRWCYTPPHCMLASLLVLIPGWCCMDHGIVCVTHSYRVNASRLNHSTTARAKYTLTHDHGLV